MLHSCTDATTASLREDVLVPLRKAILTYDKDRNSQKIGQIILQLLQDTNEPERIWLGNLSTIHTAASSTLEYDKRVADS